MIIESNIVSFEFIYFSFNYYSGSCAGMDMVLHVISYL